MMLASMRMRMEHTMIDKVFFHSTADFKQAISTCGA
jgi:hypothetical protein